MIRITNNMRNCSDYRIPAKCTCVFVTRSLMPKSSLPLRQAIRTPVQRQLWSCEAEEKNMKGNKTIITWLNKILKNELTAINQYFLHARICSDWGLDKIAAKERHESIDEMKHADKLIERILFLEGLPNLQDLGKLLIGQDIKEIIECDLKMEMAAIPDLRAAIADCEKEQDYVTREILEDILESEEEHVDWLETQLDLIEKTGLENYYQSQLKVKCDS